MIKRDAKSGSWCVDVSGPRGWDGRRTRIQKRFKTKAQAQAYEREALGLAADGHLTGRLMSYGAFIDKVYWPAKSDLRASTKRGYERDLRLRLLPAFGNLPLDGIDRLKIQKMISGCSSAKVAKNAKDTLSATLTVAVEMGFLDKNPARYEYRMPPKAKPKDDESYGVVLADFEEHVKLLEWIHGQKPASSVERLVVLALCFGLRKGETLAMDWENVDFENNCIRITQTLPQAGSKDSVIEEPKTDRSNRIVPMSSWARARLEEWDALEKPEDVDLYGQVCHPIVWTQNPTTKEKHRMGPTTAQCLIRRTFEDKKYPDGTDVPLITLFSCRHSFATAAIDAGMDIAKVSMLLGHTSPTTTYNRYVKPRRDKILRDMPSIFDDAYAKAAENLSKTDPEADECR